MLSCEMIPRIVNKNNQEVQSGLFKQALLLTKNRELAKKLFTISRHSEIRNNDGFKRDHNGEVLLNELVEHPLAKALIPEHNIISFLESQYRFIDKKGSRNILNSKEVAINAAESFNDKSEFKEHYTALPYRESEINGVSDYSVKIIRNSREVLEKREAMDKTQKLRNRIIDIFEQHGIQPALLNSLEERLGINGIYNLPGMENMVKGLKNVVLVSQNDPRAEHLAEEFSHAVLEGMEGNPLIKRLYDNIADNRLQKDILGESYERYREVYNNDPDIVTKEAMAHLLTKSLLDVNKTGDVGIPKNFLQRVFQAIKDLFGRINPKLFDDALAQSRNITRDLAKDLIHGDLASQIKLDLSQSKTFYSLRESVNKKLGILERILQLEKKRLYIYNQTSSEEMTKKQREYVQNLEKRIYKGNKQKVVYEFLKDSQEKLEQYEADYTNLLSQKDNLNDPDFKLSPIFRKLREVRNYVASYQEITKAIQAEVRDDHLQKTNIYDSNVKDLLQKNITLLDELKSYYNDVAMPYVTQFLDPFAQELRDLGIPEDEVQDHIKEMLEGSEKDITLADRYLDSMAESSDPLLRLIDNVVKTQHEKARYEQLEMLEEMQKLHSELEQTEEGTEWMYQKDAEGNPTGYFIGPFRMDLYYRDLHEKQVELNKKYGADPNDPSVKKAKYKALDGWKKKHRISSINLDTGKRSYSLKKNGKYATKGWKKVNGKMRYEGFNEAQQKYYDRYMELREKYLNYMGTTGYMNDKLYLAPQMRKQLFQRLKESESTKEVIQGVKKNLKDQYQYRYDDVERQSKNVIEDFEGNPIKVLPRYYLRPLENMKELSLDATQGMISFAQNAITYKHLNKVVDALEVTRDLAKDREVQVRRGSTLLSETLSVLGFQTKTEPITKKGILTKFYQRLEDYMDMQLYGQYQADEGEVVGVDLAKAANLLNKITSVNSLGINVLAGFANIGISAFVTNTEAFTKDFFKKGDLAWADKTYGNELLDVLGDIGRRFPKGKLSLFNRYFDTISDHENSLRNIKIDKKGFSRLLNTSTLFFMTNCGEHWIQSRLALAQAKSTTVNILDKSTGEVKQMNLWDATQAVPIDPNNPDAGNKLEFVGEVVDEEGNVLSKEELTDVSSTFSRRHKGISQKLNGIYNNTDKSAIQKYAVGRLMLLFRRWIRPMMNKRFRKEKYNYDVGQVEEGYYLTAFNFAQSFLSELRAAGPLLAWQSAYGDLKDHQKKNLSRVFWESVFYTALFATIAMLESADDDSDEYKDDYMFNMANYLSRRLYTEVGALRPGPSIFEEQFKLLKSPMAAISTVDKMFSLLKLASPFSWTEEIKSGRYRGYPVAVRHLLNSPLVPMYRTIERAIYPRESVTFYK